ncbi:MAG: type IX secretion system sortase PorU [Bacteroidales bacterium]
MRKHLKTECLTTIFFILTLPGISQEYSSSSVLSSGKWYRISVTEDNIYRVDFSTLKALGLENPSNPRIFGNNTGQLSYYNDGSQPDDLEEIAIFTYTGSDGIFNEGDYLLFFGQGTGKWIYDYSTREFSHQKHNYSDTAFYFLTSGQAPGRKINRSEEPVNEPDLITETSDNLFIHEIESENILHSGREWYQTAVSGKDIEINPRFSDVLTTEKILYRIAVLARASLSTSFSFSDSKSTLSSVQVEGINLSSTTGIWARTAEMKGDAFPQSSEPAFRISFSNSGEISARGWLDYVLLHARKQNRFNGRYSAFFDSRSVNEGMVTEFVISAEAENGIVWDVSDPFNPREKTLTISGGKIRFRSETDSLKTFIAFSPQNAKVAAIAPNPVPNQDLHNSNAADMVIVVHPLFYPYAVRLAELHRRSSGLESLVTTPQQIYNEFSGGIPDIVAIRNFLKMKYNGHEDGERKLRYLLLFGDGSYDNRTPPPGNTNYIPTYQTFNSNVTISSFTSDDFYGLLDNGEGEDAGTEDLGIGRIPVSDTTEARILVSKIEKYLNASDQADWRNLLCMIADDEDGNIHISDSEGLVAIAEARAPWAVIDKIYIDAFKQTTTSTGQFYPDATRAINDRINSGALIVNYVGHGNETSLAHERIISPEEIRSWRNQTRLPLFITATCEFSRFDDISANPATGTIMEKQSSGESILLHPDGGAIALMSTTRLVYSAPNYILNRNIFETAFNRDEDGRSMRLGDIIRIAKNMSGSNTNKRNFLLLGDPALRLAWPWNGKVVTDSINNVPAGESTDTLKALSMITISGHIEDISGNPAEDFNGIISHTVFGKPSLNETLANDGGEKLEFTERNVILFAGKTKAARGRFRFSFIVPRDIDYSPGQGKIIYYASDGKRDMNGSFTDIVTGGFSNSDHNDSSGPFIRLFLNDTLFRSGGIAGSNPVLLALIEDGGGINTAGNGIGHDITFWLDGDKSGPVILNNYFQNDFGSYSSGSVYYPLYEISPGSHTLTLKAWDNFNNSSEVSIHFNSGDEENFVLKNLLNYPNPFSESTRISLQHNRPEGVMDVEVSIFNINGQIINILYTTLTSTGYQLEPIIWDGRTSGGQKAPKGIYPYSVKISSATGETSTLSGGMIIY